MKPKAKTITLDVTVPIYDAKLVIVSTDNILRERRKYDRFFGTTGRLIGSCDAICAYSGFGRFGVFFKTEAVTAKVVAHEVFHLTHRMLEWTSAELTSDRHEHAALLNGYLFDLVARTTGLIHE